jgi:glucosyl-dolichyl phosphate glucuronosyltransferase
VRALFEQTYPPERWEVVVADDGSTDDTASVVARLGRDAPVDVRHVAGPHRGANAARNNGIAAAKGDVFVFLDDDELAPSSHLRAIADHLAARPDVGGVGGPYEDAGESRVRTCSGCALGASRLAPDELSEVRELLGGNMAIRRSAIEAAGPFDEGLKGRGEETEWFARSKAWFLYDPALIMRHRRDDTGLLELCRRQFREGRGLARAQRVSGVPYRPRPARIPRLVGHFLRRRCARGAVLAARELGATVGWVGLHLRSGDR